MEERRVRSTFILELNFRKKSHFLFALVLLVGYKDCVELWPVCSSIELRCLDGFDQNNFRYSFIFSNFEYWYGLCGFSSDQSTGSVCMSYSQ